MNSTNINQVCSLCGKDIHMEKKEKILYGHRVCKKCFYAFANRRQFAFFIDGVLWRIILIITILGIGMVLSFSGVSANESESIIGSLNAIIIIMSFFIFFMKDGFGGYSPGKALMGVQVINSISGKPIGIWASFKRNLPLLIPFASIFIAFELGKGNRTGDGWAKTRVIWKKYKDKSPFVIDMSNNIT